MKTIICLTLLTAAPAALAHGGHWHLDEETLEKIFAAADAVYGWFAANLPLVATATALTLAAWLGWRRHQQRKAKNKPISH